MLFIYNACTRCNYNFFMWILFDDTFVDLKKIQPAQNPIFTWAHARKSFPLIGSPGHVKRKLLKCDIFFQLIFSSPLFSDLWVNNQPKIMMTFFLVTFFVIMIYFACHLP